MSDQSTQLASIVQRVQRLQEEVRTVQDDIKEVYAEARSNGYDVKILRAVVKHLGKDENEVAEFDSLFDLYLQEIKAGLTGAPRATHVRDLREVPYKPQPVMPMRVYQEPRLAGPTEMRQAYRAGAPISQDFTFQDASVYFAVCDETGQIKIGLSNDVDQRAFTLAKVSKKKLRIVATLPGNRQSEMHAHRHFAKWNVGGEWFDFSPECAAEVFHYVSTLSQTVPTHEVQ